jgi:hypothetical protein
MELLDKLIAAGAQAAVRASLTDFLNGEVQKGKLTAADAAYIEEGAVRAMGLGLREFHDAQHGGK